MENSESSKLDDGLMLSNNENIDYKIKILIIDNDKNNVKLITNTLIKSNYNILQSFDINEALNVVEKNRIDLIILDAAIPIFNGFQVIRKLKILSLTPNIPVIIISENLDSINRELIINAGGNEFLNKPISDAELSVRVASILKLKFLQEQLNIRRKLEINFHTEITETEIAIDNDDKINCILLVEDGLNDAKLIKAILSDYDYKLTVAETGEKAISLAQNHHFDLILLDIMLPDINGCEVCRRIKQINDCVNIPIIFITGMDSHEMKIQCLELGADDFFVKPIVISELKAKVKSLLSKKKKMDELYGLYRTATNSAITDGLTELYKRSYFISYLNKEIARSMRYGDYLSIMMIDIDNFKVYNDTLGHLSGDIILRNVGKTILDNIREVDLAARYGGEEFIVLLPCTAKEHALTIAQRIQAGLLTLTIPLSSELPPRLHQLTVSIGIADFPFCSNTTSELINKADEMLYQAKRTGKNKVCLPL